MSDRVTISKKELASLQALAVAVLNITPRLEKEPASVKARTPRKGFSSEIQKAVDRRNAKILR